MQTRSSLRLVSNPSSNPTPSTNPYLKRLKQRIEEFNLDELSPPIVTMADQRTMAQFLQAPTEGYEDAIFVPAITADNFVLKHGLLTLVQNKQFFGHDKEDPHAHVRYFNKIKRSEYDMVKALLLDKKSQNQAPTLVKAVDESCVTCGGAHSYRNCPATDGNVYRDNIQEFISQVSAVNYNQGNTSYRPPMMSNQIRPPGTLPSNTIANPRSDLKAITTESGASYEGPQISPSTFFLLKVVENKPGVTKDTMNPTNNGSTKDVQPQVVQSESTSGLANSLISEPVAYPVSTPRPNLRPSIPYPSRLQDQKLCDKANDQREKFFQIFKDLNFNISFVDALILMPKFGPSIKSLLTNKDKLCELARNPLNEHYSAVLLKKLLEKLEDPGKFFIPCDFPEKEKCLALADLGASINLMPLFVWNKLSLPDLSPTCMTLDLSDRSISRPVGVAEDVHVKVSSFHFSADFVVVDFHADPRVPLILERSFLKTGRALIDVFEGKLTLRVGKEAITFNLDQTSRYSTNYNDMTTNELTSLTWLVKSILRKFWVFLIDFLLEEVDAFLAIEDDPTSPEVDQSYLDPEGDILLLKAFLNDDPSLPSPSQGNYMTKVRKELKICEAKSDKSLIDEHPEVELKDLPPHIEYAFLEGNDKLPVIIAKDLSMEEKTALITVLKSHKRAIAWKLSDIKGIDPEFCTHKILMEEDFEPAVQHQRGVNPKIHDVIKQE
nr:reverse transcriptase domain-containing protein [Tanacetum cinerariifolium]